jgi:hypothetical protein
MACLNHTQQAGGIVAIIAGRGMDAGQEVKASQKRGWGRKAHERGGRCG